MKQTLSQSNLPSLVHLPSVVTKYNSWVAYKQHELISPRCGHWRCWPGQFLVMPSSGCCPIASRGGDRELFVVSLIRALILFMRSPPSCPNYFPKAPPANTKTLGIKISTYSWQGTKTFRPQHPPSQFGCLVSHLTDDEKSLGVEWLLLSGPFHLACAPVPLSPST